MQIRWARIVVGAFLLEVALFVTLIPIQMVLGDRVFFTAVPIGCAVLGFLFGWWVVRKAPSLLIVHGLLVGILATMLYLGLCAVAPGGIPAAVAVYGLVMFITVNGLRIVGTVAGGFFEHRRRIAGV
jgi:hypothetical protein